MEAWRKQDITKAFVFSDVLRAYIDKALSQRKFSKQKRHANELNKTIYKALQNSSTHKLLFTGQEGVDEFNAEIAKYEQRLREAGCSEEYIREMVIEKKFNYGND